MPARRSLLVALALLALCQPPARADAGDTFVSPDRKVTLKLVAREDAGTLLQSGSLELLRGGKVICQWPMDGFIFNALWSPDGNNVALNNRWANSGDYVWVISIKTATALKHPENGDSTQSLVARVTAVFPEYTWEGFTRRTTFATYWDKNGDLHVTTVIGFKQLDSGCLAMFTIYHITRGKLVLASEKITREFAGYGIYEDPPGTLVFGKRPKNKD